MTDPKGEQGAAAGGGVPGGRRSSDPLGRPVERFQQDGQWLEYLTSGAQDLRPLVLLQSLEYPAWPDPKFCAMAEAAGLRTISIRRPGYGPVPALADIDRQVDLISAFLREQGSDSIVLACSGTANTFGYRLAQDPQVGLTVLCNCCFNHYPMAEIRPDWFARHMEQTLSTETGARLALMGLKGAQAIFGKYWVTENFMQKSPGDLEYLRSNKELFAEAMDCLLTGLDIHTFILELRGTLKEDTFLKDGCFEELPVISISGMETSETWQNSVRAEAERVGVPLHFVPSGDALVLYQSAGEFIDLVRKCA